MPSIFSFKGRLGRVGFLAGLSATLLGMIALTAALSLAAGRATPWHALVVPAVLALGLWPMLALVVRRLRDIGLTVWILPALLALGLLDYPLAQRTGWRWIWPDEMSTPLFALAYMAFWGVALLWPGKPTPAPPFTPVVAPDVYGRLKAPMAAAAVVVAAAAVFIVDPYQSVACPAAKADCARLGFAGRLYAAELLVRGNRALDDRKPARALPNIDRALRLRPNFVFAWTSRGLAHAALGQHQAAVADYDHALALKPAYLKAHADRAYSLIELGRLDRAQQDFQAIYAANPDDPDRARLIQWVEALKASRPAAG